VLFSREKNRAAKLRAGTAWYFCYEKVNLRHALGDVLGLNQRNLHVFSSNFSLRVFGDTANLFPTATRYDKTMRERQI
jgi:hypothetical protein